MAIEKGWEISIKKEGARYKAGSVVLNTTDIGELEEWIDEGFGGKVSDKIRELLTAGSALSPRSFLVSISATVEAVDTDDAYAQADALIVGMGHSATVDDVYED